ncbi:MAG: imidazole glycerol phosphate synthase subunit HisH [Anaerolineae bacterium]|nr:imidazole glycerol phosphate synthase subunit HisH [Anaerolineae bacterium]
MITMIDYGIGNYRSVQKALEYVGADVVMTSDPEAIKHADKLVLPGVGAFGAAIDALRKRKLEQPIQDAVAQGTPLLGICVGMQLLLDESEELGRHSGLGLIPGKVRKFPANNKLKIPHMGWNQLDHDDTSPLLQDVADGDYAYFVHSFYCDVVDSADTIATTEYGKAFSSIIGRNNIFGIQFHAEKSQHVGLQILRNYATL